MTKEKVNLLTLFKEKKYSKVIIIIEQIKNEEKQKLLESVSLQEKIGTLGNIVNFYLHEIDLNNRTIQ